MKGESSAPLNHSCEDLKKLSRPLDKGIPKEQNDEAELT